MFIWIGVVGCAASPPGTPVFDPATATFQGDQAMAHVEAQMAFGPRYPGSEGTVQTVDYIVEELQAVGWETEVQTYEYNGVTGRNVIAKAGSGPVRIIGAHHDTRFVADEDTDNPEAPVPGANDGASGVAVLLELARVLDVEQVDGAVWLVFFDMEDNGRIEGWDWIIGSTIFVERLEIVPEYTIIVDLVGDTDQQFYYEINSDDRLQEHIWAIAEDLGYGEYFIPRDKYSILDDHTPFLRQGIPAIDIIDFDYPYWHTTEDTIDKVSPESLERVGRVVEVFLEAGGQYPEESP